MKYLVIGAGSAGNVLARRLLDAVFTCREAKSWAVRMR